MIWWQIILWVLAGLLALFVLFVLFCFFVLAYYLSKYDEEIRESYDYGFSDYNPVIVPEKTKKKAKKRRKK